MTIIGVISDRKIKYCEFSTTADWTKDLPLENWCVIIISDNADKNYIDESLRKSIDRNVGYVCAIGNQQELIHQMADEEIQYREVDIEKLYLPKHIIMTVGYDSLEEGIWFSINAAHNPDTEIKELIIIDLTKHYFEQIKELIKRFQNGYIPK